MVFLEERRVILAIQVFRAILETQAFLVTVGKIPELLAIQVLVAIQATLELVAIVA